jgi:Uma2 family endonuclease
MNLHASPASRPATYQDVIDAPENMVAEIVDGVLNLQPRPRPKHAHAITTLGYRLFGPFGDGVDGPGGWVILIEPELHLGGHVLVPDLAAWRRERLPTLPDETGITVAPDWVCEVPSPSTRALDLTRKRAAYGAQGVGWLWFVDPLARTLEGFEAREGLWTLVAALEGAGEARVAPFDAAGFPLEALWAD